MNKENGKSGKKIKKRPRPKDQKKKHVSCEIRTHASGEITTWTWRLRPTRPNWLTTWWHKNLQGNNQNIGAAGHRRTAAAVTFIGTCLTKHFALWLRVLLYLFSWWISFSLRNFISFLLSNFITIGRKKSGLTLIVVAHNPQPILIPFGF